MRKLGVCTVVIALLATASQVRAAEGPVKTKNAIDIQMQGQIDIGAIYRNEAFNYLYWGPCVSTSSFQEVGPGDGTVAQGRRISPLIQDERGSTFLLDPQLSLGFQATLPKDVIAYVELSTPFYVIGDEGGSSATDGRNIQYTYTHRERWMLVEQAYVELRDFILQDSGLDLRIGITDYTLDFRGNGNPFLIDVQNAENPFLSATGCQQYLIVGTDSAGNRYPRWDMTEDGDTRIDPGPFGRHTQEAAGVLARYATEDKGIVALDAYIFDILESYERQRDDFVAGTTLTLYFDEDRRLGKVAPTFLAMVNDSSACVATFGCGVQVYPLDTVLGEKVFEVYGEGYGQFGEYARKVTVLPSTTYGTGDARYSHIDQGAYAFYVGTRLAAPRVNPQEVVEDSPDAAYDYFGSLEPYVDVSYWEVSGDDHADGKKNSNFVSLENNNLSLIVESSYWGLDIDTNYRCARVQAGFYPYKGWHLGAMYGYFEYQDANRTVDNREGNGRAKIGDEVDLTLTWEYSTHVKFRAGTGFLWDARALGTTKGVNLTVLQMVVDF